MKEKTEKFINKIAKILAIIIVSFFLLIGIIQLYLITWGGERIMSVIESRIQSGSDGLYSFDTEEVHTSLFGTSIIFENATLKADSSKYAEQKENNNADRRLYDIKVSRLKIGGINIINFLNQKEFNFKLLKIEDPEITVIDDPDIKVKEDPKIKFTLYALFAPGLSAININSIEVKNGNIKKVIAPNKIIAFQLQNINATMTDAAIDSTHDVHGDKLFSAENLTLAIDTILNTFKNEMYHLSYNNLSFNSENDILSAANIKLEPQAGKFEFANRFGHETDRINLFIDTVLFYNLSLIELLQSNVLNAGKVQIKGMNLHAFRDKRLKLAPIYRKLPLEIIRDLELPLKIDSLELSAKRISYEEFPDKGDKEGNIYFTNINGKISNITNISENNNDKCLVKASGYVFGKGRLDAQFTFNIFNESNEFSFSGSLGEVDPVIFNEMSVPVAGVEIKSGYVNKMEFDAHAKSSVSNGKMKLYYENLNLNIINQETGNKKELQTFIANNFVVKESNPQNGEFREGEMQFERDTRKSITNFCWKTILSGMKSSIGMKEELSNEDE